MTIIQAREAAMAGKTVINCRDGTEWLAIDFKNCKSLWPESVFGEWRVKQEPVVFEAIVLDSGFDGYGRLEGVNVAALGSFVGKKVRVTVEVIE